MNEKTNMGEACLELFRSSVIIQSLVTLILVATVCFLVIAGREINQTIASVLFAVIGFWFGSKNSYQLSEVAKQQSADITRMLSGEPPAV